MSFEERLQKLQNKSVEEKKTIALLTTVAIFLPLMGVLFYLGAFSFVHEQSPQTMIETIKEDTGTWIDDTVTEGERIVASTTELIEEARVLASTTTTLLSASSTIEAMFASTTATSNNAIGEDEIRDEVSTTSDVVDDNESGSEATTDS
jgi:hypothetical protein